MLIQQRRVRNLDRHFDSDWYDRRVILGIGELERHRERLVGVGFPPSPRPGTALLPAPLGPISRFNAEGGWIVHRDRPKETDYRQIEWTRQEWRGRDRREEVRDIRDVPFQRYPRTRVPPPGVELRVVQAAFDAPVLVTPAVVYNDQNAEGLRHHVNLLLELFGECLVMTEDLEPLMRPPTRRLNWKILPPGPRSPSQLRGELQPILGEMGKRTRPVAEHRLREMESHQPDFTAVGQGGFRGYIVFGFSTIGLYALENIRRGNATYVLGSDWEEISRRTKSEVLDEGLHRERLVHTRGWEARLRRVLGCRHAA